MNNYQSSFHVVVSLSVCGVLVVSVAGVRVVEFGRKAMMFGISGNEIFT